MCVYQKSGLELSAGKHTVYVKIDNPVASGQPNLFCMDYIQFTPPAVEKVSVNSAKRFEFEDYGTSFPEDHFKAAENGSGGKVFVALYNDKQLVGLQMQDANNQQSFNIKVPCDSAFAEAKAFLWSNTVSATPLSDVKILKIQ